MTCVRRIYRMFTLQVPLKKGGFRGLCFFGLFYNPLAPFSKGDSLRNTSYNLLKQNESDTLNNAHPVPALGLCIVKRPISLIN